MSFVANLGTWRRYALPTSAGMLRRREERRTGMVCSAGRALGGPFFFFFGLDLAGASMGATVAAVPPSSPSCIISLSDRCSVALGSEGDTRGAVLGQKQPALPEN